MENKSKSIAISLIIIVILLIIGLGYYFFLNSSKQKENIIADTTNPTSIEITQTDVNKCFVDKLDEFFKPDPNYPSFKPTISVFSPVSCPEILRKDLTSDIEIVFTAEEPVAPLFLTPYRLNFYKKGTDSKMLPTFSLDTQHELYMTIKYIDDKDVTILASCGENISCENVLFENGWKTIPNLVEDDSLGFKEYRNDEFGFTLSYPESLTEDFNHGASIYGNFPLSVGIDCESGDDGILAVKVIESPLNGFHFDKWLGMGDTFIITYDAEKDLWKSVDYPDRVLGNEYLPRKYQTKSGHTAYLYGGGDGGAAIDSALIENPAKTFMININSLYEVSVDNEGNHVCSALEGSSMEEILDSVKFD